MKICLVDDAAAQRLVLASVLKASGYADLLALPSAAEAFAALGLDQPGQDPGVDLILMDISMPGIDGIEACARIKAAEHLSDIPIIMVSASTESEDLERAFAAGAMDYITKPINKVELLARVRSALKLKHEMDRRKAHERELLELTEYLEAANHILWREQDKSDRLLRAIYALGASISSNVTLESTLQQLVKSINGILAYDAAQIAIHDPQRQQLAVMLAATRQGTELEPNLELAPDGYPLAGVSAGWLSQRRGGLLLAADDPALAQLDLERWGGLAPAAYLGMPLLAGDELVGTIELVSAQAGSFTQDNLRFLESLAPQAAMAVRNAQEAQLRDQRIKAQISELRIEIDADKLSQQVEEIVGSEFFQAISARARRLRGQLAAQPPAE
ncbi:MAG TPA: response regulator [Herpetosiphonaceae bacterium]